VSSRSTFLLSDLLLLTSRRLIRGINIFVLELFFMFRT
jgi:hypothetical protein